ncbi:TAXI family TRAP transporter solute-binding subunit [Streptomyces swartbergensis]|uniref:TAXI family TRAP transporter solute-binding subunit n=1 Tax=Streptomyces swartbergensis TaxID=487165 RepID=UPI003812FF9C
MAERPGRWPAPIEVAPALSDIAWAAYGGTAPFDRRVPQRAIGRVYENHVQLAVRSGAPIHTVADLAGRTVSLGAPASCGAVLGDRLLRVAGVTPGTDVRVRHLLMPQAARAMRAGAIDALLVAGGPAPRTVRARHRPRHPPAAPVRPAAPAARRPRPGGIGSWR